MAAPTPQTWRWQDLGIALFCFGYFAAYIPYSMLTKLLSKGALSQVPTRLDGASLLFWSTVASTLTIFIYVSFKGWWRHASQFNFLGLSLPRPRRITFLSGLCTAGQILTTTLAYTFDGVSIVLAMLMMRGGVMLLAPVVDLVVRTRKRKIQWPSLVASILALIALCLPIFFNADFKLSVPAMINIAIYLGCYFVRLYMMSRFAKSDSHEEKLQFFTEEQMVANGVIPFILLGLGLLGSGQTSGFNHEIWYGIVDVPTLGSATLIAVLAVGFFSAGTGLFGSMILLDKRENTFTAPANRASSILAGVLATVLLSQLFGLKAPASSEFIGAAFIVLAIFFLMWRAIMDKQAKAARH